MKPSLSALALGMAAANLALAFYIVRKAPDSSDQWERIDRPAEVAPDTIEMEVEIACLDVENSTFFSRTYIPCDSLEARRSARDRI